MKSSDAPQQANWTIEPANPSDTQVITDYNIAMAHETEEKPLSSSIVLQGVKAIFENPTRGRYLVARQEGQVIGQLLITLEWSDWRNGNIWWIQSVYVAPEYRRKGVFRDIFDHVQKEAQSRDDVVGLRLYVEQENEVAKSTYRNLGMTAGGYEVMELMK